MNGSPMRYLLVLSVLLIINNASVSAANVALNYNNAMILQDVLLNDDNATVSPDFVTAITSALNNVKTVTTNISADIHKQGKDLVVLSGAWAVGTKDSAESSMFALDSMYMAWRQDDAGSLTAGVSKVCLDFYGRQPSLVNVTDSCQNSHPVDISLPVTCFRNLSVSIYTSTAMSDGAAVRAALCRVLPTDCSLVILEGISQETGTVTSLTLYNKMMFTIYSDNRDKALVTLVNYARHASTLSALQIAYIRVNDVQVYYEGDTPTLSITSNDMSECTDKLWYLIFLLILIPIIIIISQRCYYRGAISGKKSIRDTEADIRAGVHVSATPWSAFGSPGASVFNPGLHYREAAAGNWMGMNGGGGYPPDQNVYSGYPQQQCQGGQQSQMGTPLRGWGSPMQAQQQRQWAPQQQWNVH